MNIRKDNTDRNLINNDSEKASSYRSNADSERSNIRKQNNMIDPRDVDL